MKVENFSDEKVREMAENVRLNKITIPQSSFDAMKARCALFDELVEVVKYLVEHEGMVVCRETFETIEGSAPNLFKDAKKIMAKVNKL